jgi:hypothetical protein
MSQFVNPHHWNWANSISKFVLLNFLRLIPRAKLVFGVFKGTGVCAVRPIFGGEFKLEFGRWDDLEFVM